MHVGDCVKYCRYSKDHIRNGIASVLCNNNVARKKENQVVKVNTAYIGIPIDCRTYDDIQICLSISHSLMSNNINRHLFLLRRMKRTAISEPCGKKRQQPSEDRHNNRYYCMCVASMEKYHSLLVCFLEDQRRNVSVVIFSGFD